MSHIRTRAVLLGLALAACAGPHAQVGLGAASSGSGSAPRGVAPSVAASTLDADPELASDRRALVARGLTGLAARGLASPPSEAAALSEIFGPLALERAPAVDSTQDGEVEAWIDAARVRKGRPRPGDLAVFRSVRGAPRIAVVTEVRTDGSVEALALTRGAWRPIQLDPEQAKVRRHAGRIVNTFIRARRPDDPRGARYLAGELFVGYRTLLD